MLIIRSSAVFTWSRGARPWCRPPYRVLQSTEAPAAARKMGGRGGGARRPAARATTHPRRSHHLPRRALLFSFGRRGALVWGWAGAGRAAAPPLLRAWSLLPAAKACLCACLLLVRRPAVACALLCVVVKQEEETTSSRTISIAAPPSSSAAWRGPRSSWLAGGRWLRGAGRCALAAARRLAGWCGGGRCGAHVVCTSCLLLTAPAKKPAQARCGRHLRAARPT